MATDDQFDEILRAYAAGLTKTYQSTLQGQKEDQLKGPITTLIQAFGRLLDLNVVVKTESRVAEVGRPDAVVGVDNLPIGYVELKPPGATALPTNYKGHDRQQWLRFRDLLNLIYTDGQDFTLWQRGERIARVKLPGSIETDGDNAVGANSARDLRTLLAEFLGWEPIVPKKPKALAEMLAPLCHMLRNDVLVAVQDKNSGLSKLAADWRQYLFPDADDAQFADAYAQTLTYSLLLAKVGGAPELTTDKAATTLETGHALLARALRVLDDPRVELEIGLAVEQLRRVIGAVDVAALSSASPDPWLYFYEDFLAEYDPRLRNDRGVYYTPVPVVKAQVRLVAQLLQEQFRKELAYADSEVVLLDPAVGTGTYPLAAFEHGIGLATAYQGEGMKGARATDMGENFHAFEILVGPYAVAHLRLTQAIQEADGSMPTDGAHVYLTDTLDSPHAAPPGQTSFFHSELAEEHKRAQKIKADTRVLVCIGNPPYDRQQIDPDAVGQQRKGGWVRYGDEESRRGRGILEDFIEPAREAGAGVHVKNLYNDYVYFWRWALWKVFEQTGDSGIVSFITAASYLRGPGFIGMRQLMRQTFDELWIIDLEGDNLGARRTENVFAIQTPVAIAVGVRYGDPDPGKPARVRYARITGTRDEKYEALDRIERFKDLTWQDCFSGWTEPLLPEGQGDYYAWPLVTDLFPWQHSGSQFKRTWPIGETTEVLERRWAALLDSTERDKAFRETRDRRVSREYEHLTSSDKDPAIQQLPVTAPVPPILRYSFRSFDRQWVLADSRVGDFLRPSLWGSQSDGQVYLTSLFTGVLGLGPAATVAGHVPDLHHFRGSFGGKDAIPLYRDTARVQANVTAGLLDLLSTQLGVAVSAEDLFAYTYGVLASPAYVDTFSEELVVPGPRLPITSDRALFEKARDLGRHLVFLHTFGERFVPAGATPGRIPRGKARNVQLISPDPNEYPDEFSYDELTQTLTIGTGTIQPVAPEVWNLSISGVEVVDSWLGYRMKDPAGKGSSVLDEIRPERWTAQMTDELLNVLWTLETTVELYPELEALLEQVISSPLLKAEDLPTPTDEERKEPKTGRDSTANQEPLFD